MRRWSPRLPGIGPQVRRHHRLGLAGSLALAVGACTTGALPVTGWLPWTAGTTATRCGFVLATFGITLLVGAWLGLGRLVSRGEARTGELLRVWTGWSAPLLLVPPLFSQDVYSYVVQGAMFRDGLDPYRFGADAYGGELAANVSSFWQDSTAPYGPVFLLLAAGVMCLAGAHVVPAVLALRLITVAAAVGIVALCLALARRSGADRPTALWLGPMNPLFIAHFVAGVHNDALIVVMIMAAMLLASHRRPLVATAVVAVAVLIKASALVAVLFLIPAAGRRIGGRRPLIAGAVAVAVVTGLTMSLVNAALGSWYGWVGALRATTRAHNGLSLSTDLGLFLDHLAAALGWIPPVDLLTVVRVLALGTAACLLPLIMLRTRGKPLLGLGLALVTVTLLGPVVHPWYLLWGFVPLAAATSDLRVVRAVAGCSVLLLLATGPSGGSLSIPTWCGVLGVGLGIVAAATLLRPRRTGGTRAALPDPAPSPPDRVGVPAALGVTGSGGPATSAPSATSATVSGATVKAGPIRSGTLAPQKH